MATALGTAPPVGRAGISGAAAEPPATAGGPRRTSALETVDGHHAPTASALGARAPAPGPPPGGDRATGADRGRARPARPRQPLDERLPRMARAFATLFLEIEAGQRPRRHLRRLMCPVLYARLSEVWVRPRTTVATLLSVHGRREAPGVYDVVATVDRGHRVTAVGFVIRRGAAGWRVEDLVRPEDGPLPDPPYPVPQDEPDVFELLGV